MFLIASCIKAFLVTAFTFAAAFIIYGFFVLGKRR